MSHPNETMLRRAYAAMSTGDLVPMLAMLSDEVHWHVDSDSPLAGEYVGKSGVLEFFAAMAELYGSTLAVEVGDVVANDHLGIVLTNESGTVEGEDVAWTSAHVYRIEDGAVVSFSAYTDDAYHALWAARQAAR